MNTTEGTTMRDVVLLLPGPCECDRPRTAAEIRRMKICGHCEKPGLDMIDLDGMPIHVRCLATTLGVWAVAKSSGGRGRARLCCLGPFRMKRLLGLLEDAKRSA